MSIENQTSNLEVEALNNPMLESIDSSARYSFDDLKAVWHYGMTNGATMWEYCKGQELKNTDLWSTPESFNKAVIDITRSVTSEESLKQVMHSREYLLMATHDAIDPIN